MRPNTVLAAAFLAAWAGLAADSLAAPSIGAVGGDRLQGSTVTISGASFGGKSPAKPLVWAPFDSNINPTILGQRTSWSSVGSMAWSSDYGGTAKASNGNGNWTLEVDYNYWTADGQKIYIFKKEKQNFLITSDTQNWKIWRMWSPSFTYPNIYAASSNGRVYTEGLGSESGYWGNFRVTTTDWVTVELIVRASTYGVKDGLLKIIYNCQEKASGTIMTRDSTDSDYMTMNFVVHGVLANMGSWNPAWSTANNRMWADDVYVDTTWARVMIGDAATWSGCTRKEIQIPSAWSDTSITATFNQGAFSTGASAWLYVVDSAGTVNSAGFPITIGPVTYHLTVNSGSGSGDYAPGAAAAISANAAPSGKVFAGWTGDTACVAAPMQASTTVTMPTAAVSVTATYVSVYRLTVNSGSGDGQYQAGTVVGIQADAAPSGKVFAGWTGDVAAVADASAAATTITMPAAAAEVTATYAPPPVPGDLNGDGFVGQGDLNIVLAAWGDSPPGDPRADPNHDNFVGQGDLNIVLAHWGQGTPP